MEPVKGLFKKGAIIVVLGDGGVGKTTLAAALGMAAARTGFDTGLITVDPARRLRDALGLEHLSARPRRLDSRRLRAAGLHPQLKLAAMVVDVKRTWDELVGRFVKSDGARQRILDNPFYRNLTERFAGAESYAALEQLYELHSSGRFDVEIVDTPPVPQALDFIEAPSHLMRLFDPQMMRWLSLSSSFAVRNGSRLIGRAGRFVLGHLESFAGVKMLTAASEFFATANQAVCDLNARFCRIESLLRSPALHFVLVTTAEEDRLREARDLAFRMERQGLQLSAVVINRMLEEGMAVDLAATPRTLAPELGEALALRLTLADEIPRGGGVDALVHHLESYAAERLARAERVARFAQSLPADLTLAIMPDIDIGVRDLQALSRLSVLMADATAGRTQESERREPQADSTRRRVRLP